MSYLWFDVCNLGDHKSVQDTLKQLGWMYSGSDCSITKNGPTTPMHSLFYFTDNLDEEVHDRTIDILKNNNLSGRMGLNGEMAERCPHCDKLYCFKQ
jgi:hypothetical protein